MLKNKRDVLFARCLNFIIKKSRIKYFNLLKTDFSLLQQFFTSVLNKKSFCLDFSYQNNSFFLLLKDQTKLLI